jgi:hypothetical protein
MSLVAIVNLAQRLLNQTFEQEQNATSHSKQAKTAPATSTGLSFEDQFTSSAANGPATRQEAGLFNVQRFAVFSAAADFLLSQPIQAAAAPAEPPVALKVTPNDSAASPAAQHQNAPVAQVPTAALPVINAAPLDAHVDNNKAQATSLNSTNQIPAPAPTEEVQATQSVPQAAATAAQPNPQSQLQSLNNSLASLGLNAADISIIDRIASLIQDFNPTAFSSLAYQLEGMAKANASTNTAAAAPSTLSTQANANNFQIQELVVRFSAVDETLQTGNPPTGGTSVNFSAFNLQVEGVNLTFTNGTGKRLQVQAPQNSANSTESANSGHAQTKAATA